MLEFARRVALAAAAVAALSGCDGAVRSQNEVCSGIPGDPTTPRAATNAPATHGPGVVAGTPAQMRATGGWPHRTLDMHGHITMFPMLVVYDDDARFLIGDVQRKSALLADPVLEAASRFGFWGEVVDGRYYQNPGVSSCEQTILLGDDFNFRAPAHGALFVQYLTPQCATCDRVSAAIERTLAAHPEISARWVQYDLSSTTAVWCSKGYGFEPRDRLARDDLKDYACPK